MEKAFRQVGMVQAGQRCFWAFVSFSGSFMGLILWLQRVAHEEKTTQGKGAFRVTRADWKRVAKQRRRDARIIHSIGLKRK